MRGVRTVGYEPVPGDMEALRKEREARQVKRIEPTAGTGPTAKASARGGGHKAVLAALEAVLVAQRVPAKRRETMLVTAAETLAKRIEAARPGSARESSAAHAACG